MNNDLIRVDGKFYKKCEVVMLPTKESSLIQKNLSDGSLSYYRGYYGAITKELEVSYENQCLYFLSDEEIKEGDWCYHLDAKELVKFDSNNGDLKYLCYKVIATTDEELGLGDEHGAFYQSPSPSNEFLKKYCKLNGQIDKILVEYESKQECLQKLKVAPDNTITIIRTKSTDTLEEGWTEGTESEYGINKVKRTNCGTKNFN